MQTKSDASSTYNIRPAFENKFNSAEVKESVRLLLIEELGDKIYDPMEAPDWTMSLSQLIQSKMKEMPYERYKFIVQVIIGEQKGQGMKEVSRCLWDADTDNFASVTLTMETLFCIATVFATYYY